MCKKCFIKELSHELIKHCDDLDTIKQLVLNGADVNYQTKRGWCIVLEAARLGNVETLMEVVRLGADINATDIKFRNALYWAMYCNKPEIVDKLLELGIDTTADVYPGMTALDYALYKKNDTLVACIENSTQGSSIYTKRSSYRSLDKNIPAKYACS